MSAPDHDVATRLLIAEAIALRAGERALGYFRDAGLERQSKGPQDFVSEADRSVEALIRKAITALFPADGLDGLRARLFRRGAAAVRI